MPRAWCPASRGFRDAGLSFASKLRRGRDASAAPELPPRLLGLRSVLRACGAPGHISHRMRPGARVVAPLGRGVGFLRYPGLAFGAIVCRSFGAGGWENDEVPFDYGGWPSFAVFVLQRWEAGRRSWDLFRGVGLGLEGCSGDFTAGSMPPTLSQRTRKDGAPRFLQDKHKVSPLRSTSSRFGRDDKSR